MKKRMMIGIFSSIVFLLSGCGESEAVANKETKEPQKEEISVEVDSPTASPASTTTVEPLPAASPEPMVTEAPSFYGMHVGDFGDYNIVLEVNGYLYRFFTEMSLDEATLLVEPATEEEKYGSKVMVSPAFVTNGVEKEQLGVIHGYQFEVRSDRWVQPQYLEGDKLCGRISSMDEGGVMIYLAEEVDRDTYMEFVNFSEKETYYEFSDDVEYVVRDINVRDTEVTRERFEEHLKRNPQLVYYLFVQDGKIVQIWEPYIP